MSTQPQLSTSGFGFLGKVSAAALRLALNLDSSSLLRFEARHVWIASHAAGGTSLLTGVDPA